LIDECLGRPHITTLKTLVENQHDEQSRPVIEHLLNLVQEEGVWDEVWVPTIAHDGWILISGDKSRFRRGKGEPLSRVCAAYGVTHVLLSAAVNGRKTFDKLLTIASLWYQILALVNEPRGSKFMIEPIGNKPEDRGRGKLVAKPPPNGIVLGEKRQVLVEQKLPFKSVHGTDQAWTLPTP